MLYNHHQHCHPVFFCYFSKWFQLSRQSWGKKLARKSGKAHITFSYGFHWRFHRILLVIKVRLLQNAAAGVKIRLINISYLFEMYISHFHSLVQALSSGVMEKSCFILYDATIYSLISKLKIKTWEFLTCWLHCIMEFNVHNLYYRYVKNVILQPLK